jgi:hypothetical protein
MLKVKSFKKPNNLEVFRAKRKKEKKAYREQPN